ncbi:MAG: CapA family protein [Bacteroidales bacterium]|nr:CapA family protein [Bacteroidales bacterium]
MSRKALTILFLITLTLSLKCQLPDSSAQKISLLFIGDIMGHDSQILAAKNEETGTYDYNDVFTYLRSEIGEADFAIANLEVTLAGPPYKGYPQFSSPAALASACRDAGIDCLVTANNHSVDRGLEGIEGTIKRLDSIGISHTGIFADNSSRDTLFPLLIKRNGISLAILNYTYGTNGLRVPHPAVVNMLDKTLITNDIKKARELSPDVLVLFLHWGTEYDTIPSKEQSDLVEYCFSLGVDLVIGSHPHVLQKMVWYKDDTVNNGKAVIYSLGNFISNQRKPKTDGGSMVRIILTRERDSVKISEAGYYLTWVYTPVVNEKKKFFILPCSKFENEPAFFTDEKDFIQMKKFISDSRRMLYKDNLNVCEYLFKENKWVLYSPEKGEEISLLN